ncbi:MAG: TonB family protein [Methylocapsa sp.]|nr:TonB family protein [Methylocapsa sp.]
MTGAAAPALLEADGPQARRWLICAAVIVATHAGLILWLAWHRDISAAGGPPAAILIDLPPMEAAPAPESPRTPSEESKASEANPAPQVESPRPLVVPELPQAEKPPAVLVPPPKPKPKPAKKEAPRPTAKPVQKAVPKMPAAKTGAAKTSQAPRGQAPAALQRGEAGSAASAASWRSQVYAHLLSHKPAGGGGSGVVTVAFNLSRSGALLGVRLVATSGSQELDRRALEMVRGANPFPAAPSGVAGGAFTVPVRFTSR